MEFSKPINWGMKKFFPENMTVVDNGHAVTMTEKLSVKMAEHFDDAIAAAIIKEMGAQGATAGVVLNKQAIFDAMDKQEPKKVLWRDGHHRCPPVHDSHYPPHRLRQCPLLLPLRAVCVMEVGVMDRRMCHNCTGNMYPDGDGWKCSACGVRVNAEGRYYFPKPNMTNADKIRAMTDEELEKLLIEFSAFACIFPDKDCEEISCVECVTKWLKQPAEESHG